MRSKRSPALLLLLMLAVSGCGSLQRAPRVQSPQRVTSTDPAPDPAKSSPVVKNGEWCLLRFEKTAWSLCNIHYHRPAEHGRAFDGSPDVIPPCGAAEAGTSPRDWVEIHYVYIRSDVRAECGVLHERALDRKLGDCPSPYIVRAVWARVTTAGDFKPKSDPLPDSDRYVEYDGSTTGDSGGRFPAHWKINRTCREVTADALDGIHLDPTRGLQPPPAVGKPESTKDFR